jgi:hypothetical protein
LEKELEDCAGLGGLYFVNVYLILNIGFIVISILYIKVEQKVRNKDRKYVMGLLIILFSILMAIRPLEMPDTLGYVQNFDYFQPGQRYQVNFFQKYMGNYEYGYIFLIQFFKRFSNNCRLFFFFTALVGTCLAVFGLKQLSDKIAVKNSGMYAPVFAIYIASFGLLYNGISVRAGLAMGMGIVAVNFVMDRKWIRGGIILLTALTIQRSAVLFFLVLFAVRFMPALRRKTHIFIWIMEGVILFSGFGDKVFPFISRILYSIIVKYHMTGFGGYLLEVGGGIGLRTTYYWLLYGILVLFLFYSRNYEKYFNIIMLGSFIVVFMHGISAIARAYDMFYLFSVPLLGAMYNEDSSSVCIRRERRMKILILINFNALIMLRLCFG